MKISHKLLAFFYSYLKEQQRICNDYIIFPANMLILKQELSDQDTQQEDIISWMRWF